MLETSQLHNDGADKGAKSEDHGKQAEITKASESSVASVVF
jgi:hypothetical protein